MISVGRLDLTTEGLLLLTNDGELARFLELPTTGWARRYRVRVNGFVDPNRLLGLARGIAIDGIQYGPIEAVLDRQQGANAWMTVTLREGKNREVRNVMESMGLTVNRLIRVAYGPFQLGKLERGEVEEVPKRVLHDQVAKFFADRGDEPGEPNTGTAKAKPRPKPRHTSTFHSVKPGSGGGPDRPRPPAGGAPSGSRSSGGRPSAGRPGGNGHRATGDRRGSMELVGGDLRGRRLEAPAGRDIRPTSDRTREAIFNILAHAEWAPEIAGIRVLDAFCGTGALGLEALSRGAGRAIFMDQGREALDLVRRNVEALGVETGAPCCGPTRCVRRAPKRPVRWYSSTRPTVRGWRPRR